MSLKTKEELEAMGIDFSKENNNELSVVANLEDIDNHSAKIYTAFNPSDYAVCIDDTFFGEIQSVTVNAINKTVEIIVVLFGKRTNLVECSHETVNYLTTLKDSKLTEIYANEYGYSMHRFITGLTYMGHISNVDVDDPVIEHKYVYSFEDIADYKPGIPEIKK
ncbi:MAG: hypothetical protein ACRDB0_01330 [Paraclostridium sp.]